MNKINWFDFGNAYFTIGGIGPIYQNLGRKNQAKNWKIRKKLLISDTVRASSKRTEIWDHMGYNFLKFENF